MKTAVEWLWENLDVDIRLFTHCKDTFEQAKELEKQQIIDAVNSQRQLGCEKGKHYYNEKFNK